MKLICASKWVEERALAGGVSPQFTSAPKAVDQRPDTRNGGLTTSVNSTH